MSEPNADPPAAAYATDRPRQPAPWWRNRHTLIAAGCALVLAAMAVAVDKGLRRQATPSLAAGEFSMGEVQRGLLTVTAQGAGSLRPVDERWLTAKASGVLAEIRIAIGVRARAGDVVVRLANPALAQLAAQAEQRHAEARASHSVLLAQIADRKLAREAAIAAAVAAVEEAALRLQAEAELMEKQAISAIAFEATRIRAEQAQTALDIERRRAAQLTETVAAESEASDARLANSKLALEQAQAKAAALAVRAEADGIVQALPASLGESVAEGAKVARIADPSRLHAVVRVPESWAGKLATGQAATVRVASADVSATVSRVDPSVTDGSVAVDLAFAAPLPDGVYPDLSIRATITVAAIEDALFVRRPAGVRDNQTADVFVLNASEDAAVRTLVQFGTGTVRQVQVLDGLQEGDRILLGSFAHLGDVDAVAVD